MKPTTELLAEIKENRRKLDECPRHKFNLPEPPYLVGSKWICLNCGGVLPGIEIGAYCRGYKAAGGNPNDIVEGWE